MRTQILSAIYGLVLFAACFVTGTAFGDDRAVIPFQFWLAPQSTEPDPAHYGDEAFGVSMNALLISGGAYDAVGADTIADFLSVPPGFEDLLDKFETKINNNITAFMPSGFDASTYTGLVIMDIEGDAAFGNIEDIVNYNEPGDDYDYQDILDGWRTCVEATRDVFPNALIGWYGTPTRRHDGNAYSQTAVDAWLDVFDPNAGGGGFGELDVLVPMVYPSFGPNDVGSGKTFATDADLATRLQDIVENAIEVCNDINGVTVGHDFAIIPLTYFGVAHSGGCQSGSCDHQHYLLEVDSDLSKTLIPQIAQMFDSGADAVAFWSRRGEWGCTGLGTPTFGELEPCFWAGQSVDVGDYFRVILEAQNPSIPGIPGDYTGDGYVTFADYTVFLNALSASDPSADLNHDRAFDTDDSTLMTGYSNTYGP